jgi:hypothetical protein
MTANLNKLAQVGSAVKVKSKDNRTVHGAWFVEEYVSKAGKHGVAIAPISLQDDFWGKLSCDMARKLAKQIATNHADADAYCKLKNSFVDSRLQAQIRGMIDSTDDFLTVLDIAIKLETAKGTAKTDDKRSEVASRLASLGVS